jgi:hypothetical protein
VVILGYVVSKVGKLHDPKNISVILNMPTLKHQKTYRFSMGWLNFINVSSTIMLSLWPPSWSSYAKQSCLNALPNVKKRGRP